MATVSLRLHIVGAGMVLLLQASLAYEPVILETKLSRCAHAVVAWGNTFLATPASRKTLLDKVMALEKEVWPVDAKGARGTRQMFQSRLQIFEAGFIHAATPGEGKLIGLATSMIIDRNQLAVANNWEELTSNGTIANHNPLGDTLCLVSLGTRPLVGQLLMKAQINLARKRGLKSVVAIIGKQDTRCYTEIPSNTSVKISTASSIVASSMVMEGCNRKLAA